MIFRELPVSTSYLLFSEMAEQSWMFQANRTVAIGPASINIADLPEGVVCFRDLLDPADADATFAPLDLAHFPDGQVALTPIAVVKLRSRPSIPWPTRRATDNALICLILAGDFISRVAIVSCAAMLDATRQGLVGGTAFANAVRSLSKTAARATCDEFDLTVYHGPDAMTRDVVVSQASGGVVAVQRYPAVVAPQPPAAPEVTLPVREDSVFALPGGEDDSYMVLDIATHVRLRSEVEWVRRVAVPDGAADLIALVSTPALAALPAGARGSSQSHECFVFLAAVAQDGARPTALVVWRRALYHVAGLDAALGTDLRTSAEAYARALSGDAAADAHPPVDVTLDGSRVVGVRFFVFTHQAGSRRGAQTEARVLVTQWTALHGPVLTAMLKDGRRRRSSVMPRGASGEEDFALGDEASSDADHRGENAEGTVGAYLATARSCDARGVLMTEPMYAAARSNGVLGSRAKVRQGAPRGTRVVRPQCADDVDLREDADAVIPLWEWGSSSRAVPPARRSHRVASVSPPPPRRTVSSSSVLAYHLGLVDKPTDVEFVYTDRQVAHAASVPMEAVVRRARTLFGVDTQLTSDVVVAEPPPSAGVVQASSTDVDLFEEHMHAVTTNSEIVRRATLIAAKIFPSRVPPEGSGDGCSDDESGSPPPRSLEDALAG